MAIEEKDLAARLQRRLSVIQQRHNFNPKCRAQQIRHIPEVAKAYGAFQELLRLIDAFQLQSMVNIPYDPQGLHPTKKHEARKLLPVHVYFARKDGTTIWKVGSSKEPPSRVKQVQTGNDGTIHVRYVVTDGGRQLEELIKKRLQPWKTRNRNDPKNGEWFDLDPLYVKELVRCLQAGVTEFDLPSN